MAKAGKPAPGRGPQADLRSGVDLSTIGCRSGALTGVERRALTRPFASIEPVACALPASSSSADATIR
jgi:hypothetical protein